MTENYITVNINKRFLECIGMILVILLLVFAIGGVGYEIGKGKGEYQGKAELFNEIYTKANEYGNVVLTNDTEMLELFKYQYSMFGINPDFKLKVEGRK